MYVTFNFFIYVGVFMSDEISRDFYWVRDINGFPIDVLKLAKDFHFFDGKMKSKVNAQLYLQKYAKVGMIKSIGILDELMNDEDLKRAYFSSFIRKAPLLDDVLKDAAYSDGLCCPMCFSSFVEIRKKGYSLTKGLLGGVFAGYMGLLVGFWGSTKLRGICKKCGHRWKIKKS